MPSKTESILIIGAGVFGLTTALELHRRGYQNITILDRFLAPVPDGSSTDISRIIRADYADPLYTRMGFESMKLWETSYKEFYSSSGVVWAAHDPNQAYINSSKANLAKLNLPFVTMENDGYSQNFPSLKAAGGNYSGFYGHSSPGGWADAAGSIRELAVQCSLAGICFITGRRGTVLSLQRSGNLITGVNVALGPPINAKRVIVAAGAWSCRLVDLEQSALSTCQPLGFLQLTPHEANELKGLPVLINMTTGWFSFPPDPTTNILKVARHGYGYTTAVTVGDVVPSTSASQVSAPLRDSNNAASTHLPADADRDLRAGLRQFFPRIAERPWLKTRLCWYTDTPKGDFIVDQHPELEGLFMATGGSGHAFKFLPVLGKYVADCFENIAPEQLREKWRFGRMEVGSIIGDGSRAGPSRRRLTSDEVSKL